MDCHGKLLNYPVDVGEISLISLILAFTSEQMGRLSDIVETVLPQSTSSPRSSRTATRTPDSMQFTPDLELESPPPIHVPNGKVNESHQIYDVEENVSYGELAKEFGVEAHLVEALAQRLSKLA